MLKRVNRLKGARLSNPKTFSFNFFNAKVARNDLGYPRVSFIVSKKVDKRATARNKIRRRISGTLEKHLGDLLGIDILIYPKKEALIKTTEEVEKETGEFINKIK